jgi:cobalt/nickel transport system permease protein
MHIPDGFLAPPVWAAFDIIGIPAIGLLARRARKQVEDSKIPLLGVLGAFVFAAQMINFPVGLGTSGHLVGGALLACTLGPAPAAIVMTAILVIQSLVFQDGGILALGTNVFNMAIAGVFAGYLPYKLLRDNSWRKGGIFLAGLASVLCSACLALSQLLISGVPMSPHLLWVAVGLFTISAVMEGVITLAVVQGIERLNSTWIPSVPIVQGNRRLIGVLATFAILLAAVGVLFASTAPDGLESIVRHLGFIPQSRLILPSPLADYEFLGVQNASLRKASAGLAGLVLIYVACLLLGRTIRQRRSV